MPHPLEELPPAAREFAFQYRAAVELHARVGGGGAGNGFLAFCRELQALLTIRDEPAPAPSGGLAYLRRVARKMADLAGEAYLVVEVPPPGMSYQQSTPYLVEEAGATDAEKKTGERIEPRARENQ
jgi:hypothetical protein